jgi:hypothetical protein
MSPEQPKFGSQKAHPKAIFMVAALPPDKVPPGDVRQAAQHMFRSYAREPGQVIRSEKEVNIAGMRGYAISGEGRGWAAVQDELTGYYCVVLVREQEGYYLLMGAVPVVDLPPYLPEFEKIARSFQPQATR